jgi:hypothetical protein
VAGVGCWLVGLLAWLLAGAFGFWFGGAVSGAIHYYSRKG